MKNFLGSTVLLVDSESYKRVGENNKNMNKVQLYFQQLKEKLAYRYFFSMSDEESHSESDFYYPKDEEQAKTER